MCHLKKGRFPIVLLPMMVALLVGALAGCAEIRPEELPIASTRVAPQIPSPGYSVVKVYYATDRAPISPSHNHPEYSSKRNESTPSLEYGYVDISIPKRHVLGQVETAPWLVRFVGLDNPAQYIDLIDGATLTDREVLAALSGSDSKSVLLFVHGYNNTFDDVATRTAQIGYDIKFPGSLMFFSWPSQGRMDGYTIDATTEGWAAFDLETVLDKLESEKGIQHITIIAHSMGNRMLSEALDHVTRDHPDFFSKVSHIIMAAPDIDADTFTRGYASIIEKAPSVTMYVSSRDKALLGSELVNGGRRLGDPRSGPLVLSPIETVDASLVDTDFIGHAYISDSPSVLSDVAQIIAKSLPADQRANLVSEFNPLHQAYWRIQLPGD
jgi:esterase/lipase superfamily enzyme